MWKVKFYHPEYNDLKLSNEKTKINNGDFIYTNNLKYKRLYLDVEINNNITNQFIKYGFLQGDGSLGRLSSPTHKGLEIHINQKKDKEVKSLFGLIGSKRTYYIHGYNDILNHLKFSPEYLPNRILPLTFKNWNKIDKLAFIKGLYSANGSVIKKHRVALKSTNNQLIEELNEYFNSIGINSYYTTNKSKQQKFKNGIYTMKESYDLNISQIKSIIKFAELIGFLQEYKNKDLHDLIQLKSPKISKITKI